MSRVQLSWFPFFQYNTDWMGREIYHGVPKGSAGKVDAYNTGVRMGAIGLLLCSITLGVTSFLVPKLCRKLTSRVVWSISNLMVFAAMVALVVLGLISTKGYNNALTDHLYGPDKTMKGMALAIFALFGIPQAVCCWVFHLCLPGLCCLFVHCSWLQRLLAHCLFTRIVARPQVLFSVPWAVASEVATEEGGGQGLSIGVLNIAIVVPQVYIIK
jgi:solute carrier family 45, member 1/2/4